MKKIIVLILLIITLSVLQVDLALAVVERGILVTGGVSICMEGETHFLLPDACLSPTYGVLIIDFFVDPSYLYHYVEVEGELYYGVECIMVDVQTITLLGDPNLDTDEDGINDICDNCPRAPNGSYSGTCIRGPHFWVVCTNDEECGDGGLCSMNQQDTYPPGGNGIGDACECEADFNCDRDVDADDVTIFLTHFGRNQFNTPCTNEHQCQGDFTCDRDVDGVDITKVLEDFPRGPFFKPCPPCEFGEWCVYP